ncbi:UbiX family flavin prenyltransferase [Amycolatopsis alkalitolerans]|uniref:Flavin prenyltransferase UbiX n=1 Tax=Amycolatopsis alkalitolerans TaxID=2547244 RepID=A0A5C4M0S5_9PSEU|nr:UbiX family flavin prenyltransferase [Amycolatopsis alkalitolerans]TNC25341.1 UbiX family flavin prenyltransferase [Amycolatopsis alkalitolerans]
MTAPCPASPRRIIVAITGASGAVYGARLVEMLGDLPEVETHLVITAGARRTLAYETAIDPDSIASSAAVTYREDDLAAAISSGSFRTEGMIIAPCSIKTLSGIANCYDDNLVVRAADVVLKERRRLALLVRETPLHALHLRLMSEVTSAGAIVVPPVPAFYHHPKTVDDIVNQTVGRTLDLFGFDTGVVERWGGSKRAARRAQDFRRFREGS